MCLSVCMCVSRHKITESQDTNTIRVGFGMQVAKTQTYPVMCRIPLFAALFEHNITERRTGRPTDFSATFELNENDLLPKCLVCLVS